MIKSIILTLFLSTLLFWAKSQQITALNSYKEITLPELFRKINNGMKDYIILDVRTKGEYHNTLSINKTLNIGRIKSAINIPLQDLRQKPESLQQLNEYKDKEVFVICSHSYRSRAISNLLLQNNFSKVTNVQGGMSEWYRNHDEVKLFAESFYENNISYENISPAQLFQKLKTNEPILFIGFKNAPRSNFDSILVMFYQHFPDFKNVAFFTSADSSAVLAKAKRASGKTIVTYNTIGIGGAEIADWLASNSIASVNYLYGNLAGFYEYMANYQPNENKENYFSIKSKVHFYSALSLCGSMKHNNSIQLIDLRHDTVFAKPNRGTKLTYRHIKGAINFPYYQSAEMFSDKFPDKNKEYVLIPQQGYVGLELAESLLNKGYRIGWLIGSNERWEWYTNNISEFNCKNYFTK